MLVDFLYEVSTNVLHFTFSIKQTNLISGRLLIAAMTVAINEVTIILSDRS